MHTTAITRAPEEVPHEWEATDEDWRVYSDEEIEQMRLEGRW